MPEPISDAISWLVLAGHDTLGLPWGWTLVLIGAALHAVTLAIQDTVDAERHRFAALAAWVPEVLLFVGLAVALGGELRSDVCPVVNPPGSADPMPCGDLASFATLGDLTAPGAGSAVLLTAGALAAVLWSLRRWLPAASGLVGLAVIATLAAAVASGALAYAFGAVAVAVDVGLVRTARRRVA